MAKAIVMTETGGPDVLKLRDVPKPVPKAGEVVLAVRAVGVNPVETYWRSGTAGRNPKLPYTPGRDASGVVEAVGEGCTVKVGERVFTTGAVTGTYATHCVVAQDDVHPLPNGVGFEAGAALGTSGMAAYRALVIRGEGVPGEKVFIHGASGGVGLVALQMARAMGMYVVGTADNQAGVELIKRMGAHEGYVHREDGYLDKVRSHGPYDLIIEMLASTNLANDLTLVALRARIVIVGSRGKITIDPRLIMTKEVDVRGLFLTAQTAKEKRQGARALSAALQSGVLRPVISQTLPLEQAPKAHRDVIDPPNGAVGKIVMIPPGCPAKL